MRMLYNALRRCNDYFFFCSSTWKWYHNSNGIFRKTRKPYRKSPKNSMTAKIRTNSGKSCPGPSHLCVSSLTSSRPEASSSTKQGFARSRCSHFGPAHIAGWTSAESARTDGRCCHSQTPSAAGDTNPTQPRREY